MIFYFHGFSSGANSQKATAIKNYLNQYSILVPDYPSHQAHQSIEFLQHYIQTHHVDQSQQKILLMGSSLGAYYAQYLAKQFQNVSAVVLINPCLQPQLTLASQIGEQVNSVTGETFRFTKEDYDGFSQLDVEQQELFNPTLVLLDEGDELIDYRVAADRYKGKGKVISYPGGDHWFRHLDQALPEIESFYREMVLNDQK